MSYLKKSSVINVGSDKEYTIKQIAKIWKSLPNEKRQPYVQQARENRTASRRFINSTRYATYDSYHSCLYANILDKWSYK